jgi:ABC-type glycerol-3-phosphate transport system substrate-binding protein
MSSIVTRRGFLKGTAVATGGVLLAACQPKIVEVEKIITREVEKVVKETVVVEGEAKVVEKVVKETVVVEAATAAPKKAVTIRFHARIGEQENKLYAMQMPKFMEANPHIKVELENFPGGEYQAKISTMHAGGTIGDVMWSALGGASVQFHFAQGIIRGIDELVAAEGYDLNQFYAGCIKGLTVEGKLTGLPFKSHPGSACVYYNEALFGEAGVDVPKPAWTHQDQIEMALAIQKIAGDRPVFGALMETGWKSFVTGIRSYGGQLLSADGNKIQLTDEKAMAHIQRMYDLFQTHKVSPTPEQIIGGTSAMWSSGNLGMFQAGTWASVLRNTIGDKFKWMAVNNPIGPGGVGGSDFEVDCDAITSTTKLPTESFEWLKYLCNQDSGVLLGVIGGTVGGRPDVYDSPVLLTDPVRPVFRDIMNKAQDSIIVGNWRQGECETALVQLMQPLWVGKEQPTTTFVQSVNDQIQAIMDKPRP